MSFLKTIVLALTVITHSAWALEAQDVVDRTTLKQFVIKAKAHLQQNYYQALADFSSQQKWRKGSIYIFVMRMDGVNLFHPFQPWLEGTNRTGIRDINGTPIGLGLLNAAEKGGGFFEYRKDNPEVMGDEQTGSPKVAYVEKVGREEARTDLVIGSGIYVAQ